MEEKQENEIRIDFEYIQKIIEENIFENTYKFKNLILDEIDEIDKVCTRLKNTILVVMCLLGFVLWIMAFVLKKF